MRKRRLSQLGYETLAEFTTRLMSIDSRGAKQLLGYRRISKADFYRWGGFSDSRLIRVTRNGGWAYFEDTAR